MRAIPFNLDIWDHYRFPCSNDLEWDGESKRIIAVGDGREKSVSRLTVMQDIPYTSGRFGHAFMMDSGTSTGEISGHAKVNVEVLISSDLCLMNAMSRLSMLSQSGTNDLFEQQPQRTTL